MHPSHTAPSATSSLGRGDACMHMRAARPAPVVCLCWDASPRRVPPCPGARSLPEGAWLARLSCWDVPACSQLQADRSDTRFGVGAAKSCRRGLPAGVSSPISPRAEVPPLFCCATHARCTCPPRLHGCCDACWCSRGLLRRVLVVSFGASRPAVLLPAGGSRPPCVPVSWSTRPARRCLVGAPVMLGRPCV